MFKDIKEYLKNLDPTIDTNVVLTIELEATPEEILNFSSVLCGFSALVGEPELAWHLNDSVKEKLNQYKQVRDELKQYFGLTDCHDAIDDMTEYTWFLDRESDLLYYNDEDSIPVVSLEDFTYQDSVLSSTGRGTFTAVWVSSCTGDRYVAVLDNQKEFV